jgi:hypothetical protein
MNMEVINSEKPVVEIQSLQEPIIIEDQNYYNDNMFNSNLSNDYEEYSEPNIDMMTYEQLIELQDRIGYVSRGYSEIEIKVFYINIELPIYFI